MLTIRPLRWPDDREALRSIDSSFTTERIYDVKATGLSFTLVETAVSPARHKDYQFADEIDDLPAYDYVVVADVDGALVGVAVLRWEAWNRRAVLQHLFIDMAHRGRGIGRALLDDVLREARARRARCLWLDTQNINYGAIQFYQRCGFEWCGLDMSLYDPRDVPAGEVALFFAYQFM
jgi:ribosomal protein S18 acetylase RimI-like enzyme